MSEVVGVVEKISTFTGAGARGAWTKKVFKVNGEQYGTFLNKDNTESLLKIAEGNTVKLVYTQNGEFKNLTSIEIQGTPVEQKAQATAYQSKSDDKDRRITYLASRKDAIELVKFLVDKQYITIPTKKSDQADAVVEYINEYARRFTDEAYGVEQQEAPVKETKVNVVE